MNLLKDIAEIVKDDREHSVEVKINSLGVTVYLEYDPEETFASKCVIPIAYTSLEEFVYIPHSELVEIFSPSDYGIDLNEITLIKRIMKYMEKHKSELNELCCRYNLIDRHDCCSE